jgi:DMSO reductase anchor subunit
VYPGAVLLCLGLVAFGLFMSTVHLGKPLRFYRGFNNLRHSPVAREGAGIAGFMGFAGIHLLAALGQQGWVQSLLPELAGAEASLAGTARVAGLLALASSAVGLYYMYRCYRIKARPFWNHKQTGFAFVGCTCYLGALSLAAVGSVAFALADLALAPLLSLCGLLMGLGLTIEGAGLLLHARDMTTAENEGAVSHYVQRTTFGKTWLARNATLAAAAAGLAAAPLYAASATGQALWLTLALAAVAVAVVGRALFYVLVVPTTMPGAFFWKNKAFEQHARDIGLADMPQVGVVPDAH